MTPAATAALMMWRRRNPGVDAVQGLHADGTGRRQRLNRGGDRQANAALHRIVVVRLRRDHRTKEYMRRRTGEGMSKLEVMRCLKRYVAREIFSNLQTSRELASSPA